MPGSAADVVDSHSKDWDILDDGYDRGPIDTWPAPMLDPSDRSSVGPIDRTGARRDGLFDAYALLRNEPDNPMARGPVRVPPVGQLRSVIRADAHGFVSAGDAAMLADAGDIYSDIATYHQQTADLFRRWGFWDRLPAANQKQLEDAFHNVQSAARTGNAWNAVGQAHQVAYALARLGLRRNPTTAQANELQAHFQRLSQAMPGGGGILSKIGNAVVSVGEGVVHAAGDVAKVAAPLLSVVRTIAPFAQTALSFVPGVGTVVNGAIAAGSALAQGKPITDALLGAVAAALPGGPLAQQAFRTAVNVVKGQNITTAALDAVRNQIPGGLAAKAAFDTAVAMAHGQSLQQAALASGRPLASSVVSRALPAANRLLSQGAQGMFEDNPLSPFADRAFSSVGPRLFGRSTLRPALLSPQVHNVASALLRNPGLRSIPIAELARRMHVSEYDAKRGMASVVSAVAQAGTGALPHLTDAGDLADRMHPGMSFDQAIATFASRATRPIYTHNRIVARRRFYGARGFVDAGSFVDAGALPPTIQQGSTGPAVVQWQGIIGVTADGKFGPQTKAATVKWQAARGLVADGIVGPKTWTAALGAPTPVAAPSTPVPVLSIPGLPSVPLPALPPAPAPPPVVVATLASQLPMLKVGSTGPAVVKWQGIIGVKADGIFGPQTQAATKTWQASRGLVADGIVGPKTWAAAMTPAAGPPPPPAPFPPVLPTTPVTVATPVGPIAIPIPTTPPFNPSTFPGDTSPIPPSVTTFPVPPIVPPAGTPPFIPGQISTIPTPQGPITGVTDPTGTTVTVTQPPITGSPPASSGTGLGIGALVVLGALLAVGSSGKKGLL